MPKLTVDTIGKSLIILNIFLVKIFKVGLCYQIFGFKIIFMLILLLNYSFTKN